MKKPIIIAVLVLSAALFSISAAWAFKITPELQKELTEKQQAFAAHPESPEACFDLAISYGYSNYVKEGWDQLRKINDLDKDKTFASAALVKYSKLTQDNPKDWKLAYRYAFALFFNGKKQEALNEFDQVLKIDPANALAYGYKALILGEMGKVDEAIDQVKKGLAIDNQIAALHLLLADGYLKKGKSWEGFWEGVEASRLKALGY